MLFGAKIQNEIKQIKMANKNQSKKSNLDEGLNHDFLTPRERWRSMATWSFSGLCIKNLPNSHAIL
jgi:hypothetical protein